MQTNDDAAAGMFANKARLPISDLSGRRMLPIGNDNFTQVVSDYVFVDKTPLVEDLLDSGYLVTLFCRPRRFGKTLAMRMMQAFFERPHANAESKRHLFEHLHIWGAGQRYRDEQGRYPVVFLTLNDVKARSWEETHTALARKMAEEYIRLAPVILGSNALDADEMAHFKSVKAQCASDEDVATSLAALTRYLEKATGEKAIVLVDEYDVPVTAGHVNGFREQAADFTRRWLTGALKSNDSLRFACLTGVQRVTKESIFSGLNNLVVNSALDSEFVEGFGFTAEEAAALVSYVGCSDHLDEMRSWYDGYSFGKAEVYNPWSVLNYLRHDCSAQVYWGKTSDNAVVHDLIQNANEETVGELYALIDGESIEEVLDLGTVFGELQSHPEAVWSQLYLAGYLTTDDVDLPNDDAVIRRLRIPNYEVSRIYEREFLDRAVKTTGTRKQLLVLQRALVNSDEPALEHALGSILLRSTSFFDLATENSYHMLVLGLLFAIPGYGYPSSNCEAGFGRCDIALKPQAGCDTIPIVIEIKTLQPKVGEADWSAERDGQRLRALAEAAIRQAEDRRYAEGSIAESSGCGASGKVLAWGIAFNGKHVAVASKPLA